MKKLIFVIILIFISFSVFAGQIAVFNKGLLAVGVDGKIYYSYYGGGKFEHFASMPVKAIALTITQGERIIDDSIYKKYTRPLPVFGGGVYEEFNYGTDNSNVATLIFALGNDGAIYRYNKVIKQSIFKKDEVVSEQFVFYAKLPENVKGVDISSNLSQSKGGLLVLGDDGMLYRSYSLSYDKDKAENSIEKFKELTGDSSKNKRKYTTGQIVLSDNGVLAIGNDGNIYHYENDFIKPYKKMPVKSVAISRVAKIFISNEGHIRTQPGVTFAIGIDRNIYFAKDEDKKFIFFTKLPGNAKGIELAGYQNEVAKKLYVVDDNGMIYAPAGNPPGKLEKLRKLPGDFHSGGENGDAGENGDGGK